MLLFLFLSLITINWNKFLAPLATSVLVSSIMPETFFFFWLSGQLTLAVSELQGS